MKVAYIIVGLVLVLTIAYALAFVGIIPAQKIANKNAAARGVLKALHLAKDPPKPKAVVAQATPSQDENPIAKIASERAQLDTDRAALDADKAAFETEKAKAAPASDRAGTAQAGDRDKLISIYRTMDPDDVAKIMAHIPDKSALADLQLMDEKKAGKVLAALPADRAAKLSELMAAPAPTTPAAAPPAPKTAL
jgi:flagellar motility protein MotE (MotC chaperone)